MKLLIHACCAPCLTYTYEHFKKIADKISVYWFNPNIHPFKEYENRLHAIVKYQDKVEADIIYNDNYDLEKFLECALKTEPRCEYCYRLRLAKTVETAQKNGFDAFTTTLTLSPYQDHSLIKKIGDQESDRYDVRFIYEDLTDGFYKSNDMADKMGLYKQGYCGCIFSERDRYEKDII